MGSKNCPACGEEILAVAKKCKHCGEWIDTHSGTKSRISKTMIVLALLAIAATFTFVMLFNFINNKLHHREKERQAKELHQSLINSLDFSSISKSATSICVALNDGSDDVIEKIFDDRYYALAEHTCNGVASLDKACGGDISRALRGGCKKVADESFAECRPEKIREKMKHFVIRFKKSGSECLVSAGEFPESASIKTYNGIADEVSFEKTPVGWQVKPTFGSIPFIEAEKQVLLEDLARQFKK